MSLSHTILGLPPEQQHEALLSLARKLIAEGRCSSGRQWMRWIHPIDHALHAAGRPQDEVNEFRRRCRAIFALAKAAPTPQGAHQ